MSSISCTAELLPGGQLILPPEIIKKLHVTAKTTRRIIILNGKPKNKNISQFCGKWKDDRDADEIISEIYENREQNYLF
ncbi:MAG TPA: hypothetical protein VK186_14665 [Candidatus Deferrimicrobium sp.]|nr:hypothetical protein [Patescibacteria group bacterium]HLP60079.1 hypothetical protein [Candidatus Deferrimicrobium sp.]